MNKRHIASAIMTGALLVSGSAFAQVGKAPSENPNDTTAAPLNQPRAPGATAPAPAGSTATGSGTMHKGDTHKSGNMHKNGTATPKSGAGMNNGSNMQSGTSSSQGNMAQPSQPRPVTGK